MVKTATDVTRIVDRLVESLSGSFDVSQVLLTGALAEEAPLEHSDIDLIVVSPDFAGMNQVERLGLLAREALKVDPQIQARGYTPEELAEPRRHMLLSMMLSDSRLVYQKPS